MEVKRSGLTNIKKKKVNLNKAKNYEYNKVAKAEKIMQNIIETEVVSGIDLLFLLKEEYDVNKSLKQIIKDIKFDFNKIRFNCVFLAMKLKRKLDEIGLNTYFITYKSHGFSTKYGDFKLKESHIALVYLSKKNSDLFFTVFDPGLRIRNVIQFYNRKDSKKYIDDFEYQIKYTSKKYPYQIEMNGYLKYNYKIVNNFVIQEFNPYYETLNINEMYSSSIYHYIIDYKAMSYSNNKKKQKYIKIFPIKRSIEFGDIENNYYSVYSFNEIDKIDKSKVFLITQSLNINYNLFMELLEFLNSNQDEIVNKMINKIITEEYLLRVN